MKLGITGLPGSGKTTVFEALTGNISDSGDKRENRIGTISVPDTRVDVLSGMYNPKKTVYARVEYFLPGMSDQGKEKTDQSLWTPVRDCDALIHVIRNFGGYGFEDPVPYKDFSALDQELVFADLVVVEKRLERLELDKKRGKNIEQEELSLLKECLAHLEKEIPLRKFPDIAFSPHLKGYAFVSAKPMLVLFNNTDDDNKLPDPPAGEEFAENSMVIRGKLEHELAQMSEEEAEDFLTEFSIDASATDRVIESSYDLLGLISFFTVGEDEVRAWTIKKNTLAPDAAEVIHSDMKKGFIRAEVVSYDDLMEAGTYNEAKKKGKVRLEGKTYEVLNGDIIQVRFNV
ncbi:MAG: redox-regulated ATPase YchF [Desulfobacterales bacterium]|nr:redox-regulated ATPase YchF [Desulfobacterales bacterium]